MTVQPSKDSAASPSCPSKFESKNFRPLISPNSVLLKLHVKILPALMVNKPAVGSNESLSPTVQLAVVVPAHPSGFTSASLYDPGRILLKVISSSSSSTLIDAFCETFPFSSIKLNSNVPLSGSALFSMVICAYWTLPKLLSVNSLPELEIVRVYEPSSGIVCFHPPFRTSRIVYVPAARSENVYFPSSSVSTETSPSSKDPLALI